MSFVTPISAETDDPYRERTERHLAMLARLAELDMQVAEVMAARAVTAKPEEAPAAGEAYSRVSRSLRQTLSLAEKLAEDRRKIDLGIATEQRHVDIAAARKRGIKARKRARWVMYDVLMAETGIADDVEMNAEEDQDAQDLFNHLEELVKADPLNFADRPLHEIVAELVEELDLTPDWERWRHHDWAQPLMPLIDAAAAEAAKAKATEASGATGPPSG